MGSIPTESTNRKFPLKAMMNRVQLPAAERLVRCVIVSKNRGVIQLVECVVWDHDAAGSSPVAPTIR